MGQAIPTQHPAVVLRSHYNHLRALLVIATIGLVSLAGAVAILATDDDRDTSASSPIEVSSRGPNAGIRYDGGPEEGTRSVVTTPPPATCYDGGPEEGAAALAQRPAPATFDANSIKESPGVRYDGGPEEGTRGALSAGAVASAGPGIRYDGGPEEGSRGSSR